jgi:hypothetical protein
MQDWRDIQTAPEGVPVETMIYDHRGERNVQVLVREKRLWWTEDRKMYVYYTPTHWRFK